MANEMYEIPMDGSPVIYDGDQNELVPAGEYLFRVLQMKRVHREAKGKMPKHVEVRFYMELENADGERYKVWDGIRMYSAFIWKYAALAKAIGHTKKDSKNIIVDWSRFEGAEGRVKVTQRKWNDQMQNDFTYLLPAEDPGIFNDGAHGDW